MSKVPAYTILNDSIEDNPDGIQSWENMYQSNLLNSSSYSNYDMVKPGLKHINYESLTGNEPEIPSSYNTILSNNENTGNYMNQQGLFPNYQPYPLPSKLNIPAVQPPYNRPYPSDGFSAGDASLAYRSGILSSVANIPVPASSHASLQDARNTKSYVMEQNPLLITKNDYEKYEEKPKAKVNIDSKLHNSPEDRLLSSNEHSIKESYSSNMDYGGMNCMHVFKHINHCPVCHSYLTRNERALLIIIGFLLLIVFVLMYLLFKKLATK